MTEMTTELQNASGQPSPYSSSSGSSSPDWLAGYAAGYAAAMSVSHKKELIFVEFLESLRMSQGDVVSEKIKHFLEHI